MQRFTISCCHKKNTSNRNVKLFKEEAVSTSRKLASLSPELGSDGLIRCNGRLKYAEFLPYEARLPVILPRESRDFEF